MVGVGIMNSTFSLLRVFLTRVFMPRHNAQMRLLKSQIHILRTRIPTQRVILSPEEKSELLRIGAECEHDIDGLMEVAKPATYKRLRTQMRGGRAFQAVSSARTAGETLGTTSLRSNFVLPLMDQSAADGCSAASSHPTPATWPDLRL